MMRELYRDALQSIGVSILSMLLHRDIYIPSIVSLTDVVECINHAPKKNITNYFSKNMLYLGYVY